ncbi:AMP-binding protein [Duganella sp. FT92W]|uniref:AMP-binding protein n=1 Tax=Pseudoduganella rivuli TaxID=2666085 RepID=A0A7X2IN88_9BURK|nr:AMP-binding protein [Pseudoduganella rivuli]MRV72593.1 AMP-binding protein [Pseudoduganella rivuli]
MNTPTELSRAKPRLLALHGSGSNRAVTAMQLENLGISAAGYDVIHVEGTLAVNEPGPGLQGLVAGPWYSWIPRDGADGTVAPEVLRNALCDAILKVATVLENEGPFDGVYGFSQGGVIATLINGLPHDEALQAALRQRAGGVIPFVLTHGAPFGSAVIACAAAPFPWTELRARAGLGQAPAMLPAIPTLHLIGRKDGYKAWSESLALALHTTASDVLYLDDGHEINRLHRDDAALCARVRGCFMGAGAVSAPASAPSGANQAEWMTSSALSARSVARDVQLTAVKLATGAVPDTILGMLAAQPGDAPLLRHARERDASVATTYGRMLAFCLPGGDGDLRRIGVQAGDVVAYLAPAGGSATAAAAFLSIASQTCAVPFGPGMTEADALMALEQYRVKHMVLFDGVAAPGVKAAFEAYAQQGHAHLHYAATNGAATPGLFRYLNPVTGFQHQPALANPAHATCLLLRTSGTTSKPKVVPQRQRDLVLNAAILADGIGIDASDVTYSVMPLDHIGGLSASLLCSIAVGASVTCEGLYNPQAMVEALSESNPRPTWYSAVPTIHNATVRYLRDQAGDSLEANGRWRDHGLRMIRSGAAALKEADRQVLETTYGCEVVATYSMSELMPIAQPPKSGASWHQLPGAVGVPVTASMAVVDPVTLRPLPYGTAGDVAISGPTLFDGYRDNPAANDQSRFLLRTHHDGKLDSWFLTGDLGELAPDGTLTLRGRLKELIKKGGEQIAPAEVEDILTQHPWINTAVCFPVPSDTYGEEVGCALVLETEFASRVTQQEALREIRELLRLKGLAAYKFPTFVKLVTDDELPKTASRKYIRNGLADVLQVGARPAAKPTVTTVDFHNKPAKKPAKAGTAPAAAATAAAPARHDAPKVDWSTLAGLRFILACYVMFMHFGSTESWGAVSNLRQFPWHVHAFFAVAGFSLVIFMPPVITRKLSYITGRIAGMYPLYAVALLFGLANLLVDCQPSTFSAVFHWNGQPGDASHAFCEGTPLVQDSWLANVLLTVGIHAAGLQASPLWGASWFMGFYLWFISVYFQCLVVFPFLYNALYKARGNTKRLLMLTLAGLAVNAVILMGFWYGYAVDATGFVSFDPATGHALPVSASQLAAAGKDNAVILGFYLFAPFWMVYFVAGMCAAFLYDAVRPAEQRRAHIWGYIADAITLLIIALSVAQVAQGYIAHGDTTSTWFMRPEAANSHADAAAVNRIWDDIYSRMFAPVTLLWVFALSTGRGVTARLLRFTPLSQTIAPAAYGCFLFQQMVGQWYYALTRHGTWWDWWSYRKGFYWFSPQPVPVEWYEYFYLVGLTVLFTKMVEPLDPAIRRGYATLVNYLKGGKQQQAVQAKDSLGEILQTVLRMTGMEAEPEWSLVDCGLASLGVVQFTHALETAFSTPERKVSLPVADIMAAVDIRAIARIVDAARQEVQADVGMLQAA